MSTEIVVAIIGAVAIIIAAIIGAIRKKPNNSQVIKKGNNNIQVLGNVDIRRNTDDATESSPDNSKRR